MSAGRSALRRGAPAPSLPPLRSSVMFAAFALLFAALAGRSLYLQSFDNAFLQEQGTARSSREIDVPAHRGRIIDRFGEPLAISTPVKSIWTFPTQLDATPPQLAALAQLLETTPAKVAAKLGDGDFVYLAKQIPPETADRIAALRIKGLNDEGGYRRFYPGGETMSHILGFTGDRDAGQEGIELAQQEWLGGRPGSRRVVINRRGDIVEDVEAIRAPQAGRDLALSLDSRLQYLAFRELKAAVERNKAKGGSLVMLDAKSGEILALASGKVRPDTVIQTAPGSFTIGSKTIHDAHPNGALTVEQVIQKSSNVGAAKIALGLPSQTLWQTLTNAGFGTPPNTGFPGEVSGRLRTAKNWKPIEQATISYGHGLSVNLVQLARGYTIFANDGELKPATLLKSNGAPAGRRVVSTATALAVRHMLELAVQPGGTAPKAQVPGYRVAGKTGTAHKLEGRGYANKYVSSFVGFAPVSDPRLIVAVMLDEPSAGEYYGGTVAAPVFSMVMGGALRLLGVPTDAPVDNVILPKDGGDIREET